MDNAHQELAIGFKPIFYTFSRKMQGMKILTYTVKLTPSHSRHTNLQNAFCHIFTATISLNLNVLLQKNKLLYCDWHNE